MRASYGLLSTYPSTQCGLATFSKALVDALAGPDDRVGVVAVVDAAGAPALPEVTHEWERGSAGGPSAAAAALNRHDVAIVQHEFGIFPGPDGEDVLEVVRALTVPAIVVLHTVLVTPTPRQRTIVEELAGAGAGVVTMTRTGRQRLIDNYAVDPARIRVIPHGAPDTRPAGDDPAVRGPAGAEGAAPVILTWGLLGEGKGIEWAIEAMARLADLRPAPRYQVVGQTHPKVLEQHGERYRARLIAQVARLRLAGSVEFDARYLAAAELHRLVRGADVVLLPYDSVEQVTSGVLIEAVAAGKPVVSTGFPHACELLSGGAGLVVERRDPAALAAALRRVLTEPGLAARMGEHATRIAPELLWPAVAEQYRRLAATTIDAAGQTSPPARPGAFRRRLRVGRRGTLAPV